MRQSGRLLNGWYMYKRIHSALGYLTAAEFNEQWRKGETPLRDLN